MSSKNSRVVVSYVIPSFNHAQFVSAAISSVLSQSMPEIELVIVDDGSTDRSVEIIRSAVQGDPRVQVIEQANQGIVATRNRGLAAIQGDLVSFLDSDDALAGDHAARAWKVFGVSPTTTFSYGDVAIVNESGYQLGRFSRNYPPKSGDFSLAMVKHYCFAPSAGSVFRRAVFQKSGGFWGPSHCTDYLKAIEAGLYGSVSRIGDSPVASWRWHGKNVSRTGGLADRIRREEAVISGLIDLVENRWVRTDASYARFVFAQGAAARHVRLACFALAGDNKEIAKEQLDAAARYHSSVLHKVCKASFALGLSRALGILLGMGIRLRQPVGEG